MKNQPALKTVLILIVGIAGGRYLRVEFTPVFFFSALLCILSWILYVKKRAHWIVQVFIAISLISIGFIRYQQVMRWLPHNHVLQYVGSSSQLDALEGYLIRDPIRKAGRTELMVESLAVHREDQIIPTRGRVLVSLYREDDIPLGYGDEMIITGQLLRPRGLRNPGGFDYKAYLARRHIHVILKIKEASAIRKTGETGGSALFRNMIYPARRFIIRTINRTVSETNSPLLEALLVGERSAIPPELRDQFARAGVMHVLTVSGLHVGFVLIILTFLFGLIRVPYAMRVILILMGLAFYTLMTEARDPVVRAAIMAGLYLMGTVMDRKTNAFNIIGVAALIILLLRPQDLFDVGFQLSFVAVISILYFYQRLKVLSPVKNLYQKFPKKGFRQGVLTIFLISIAAQIGILPLSAYYFNQIPLLSVFINIFAIPMAGLIVVLGYTCVLFNLISPWISGIYGSLNQEIMTLFIRVVSWFGDLSFSHWFVPAPNIIWISVYFVFLIFLFHLNNPSLRKKLVYLLLVGLNLNIWGLVFSNNGHTLTWIQFDVGQGDAALLHLPRGKTLLIDGGDLHPFFDNGERVIAPYLRRKGIRKIDAVFLSHPHDDHIGGLIYILNHFKIGEIITISTASESELYRQFRNIVDEKNIAVRYVTEFDSLTLHGTRLFLFSPGGRPNGEIMTRYRDINNRSLIVRLVYGNTRFLFMGDAEQRREQEILASGYFIDCDGIKVGHHGSHTSSTLNFLMHARPEHAVISVGENNQFNHPSDSVLRRFSNLGISVYRTDQNGAVVFQSNGKRLRHIEWR